MREFICFNQKITSASEAVLPAASAAAFYGRGVFTTLAVSKAKPFLWEKHWQRLKNDAARLSLDLFNFTEESVKESLAATIAANNLEGGRARITFFDQSLKGVWSVQAENKISSLIVVAENRVSAADLRVTLSPYPVNSRSPLAGIKSCNYLENLLALEDARGEGFDEAVRLNEKGEIVSACLANVFWVKNGELFTPPLDAGALSGTTRAFVSEIHPVSERRAQFAELLTADEVFLVSAGIGAARVAGIAGIKYSDRKVFEQVRKSFAGVFGDYQDSRAKL